jgi:hypothetical protein
MITNRREFVKFLALLAAGAAAKPDQIEAFERYYEANTPQGDNLVAVDEIWLSGMAQQSEPVAVEFYKKGSVVLPLGINCFGGMCRWQAAPDQKIIVNRPDFSWKFTPCHDLFSPDWLIAQVSFINSITKVRENVRITKLEGTLVDP